MDAGGGGRQARRRIGRYVVSVGERDTRPHVRRTCGRWRKRSAYGRIGFISKAKEAAGRAKIAERIRGASRDGTPERLETRIGQHTVRLEEDGTLIVNESIRIAAPSG